MNDSNPALNKAIMRFAYEEYHSGRPRALLSKAIVDPIIADCGEDAMYEHLSDLTDVGFLVLHDIFFTRRLGGDLNYGLGPRPAVTITDAGIGFVNRVED